MKQTGLPDITKLSHAGTVWQIHTGGQNQNCMSDFFNSIKIYSIADSAQN